MNILVNTSRKDKRTVKNYMVENIFYSILYWCLLDVFELLFLDDEGIINIYKIHSATLKLFSEE